MSRNRIDGPPRKPLTACHAEGGCIRAFEDGTCSDQGQCSIILAVQQQQEQDATIAENTAEFSEGAIKAADSFTILHNAIGVATSRRARWIAVSIRARGTP